MPTLVPPEQWPEGTHPEVSRAGEVLAVLVEGAGHDAVRRVEGLLHPVAMVDVYVDVQHPLVVPAPRARTHH